MLTITKRTYIDKNNYDNNKHLQYLLYTIKNRYNDCTYIIINYYYSQINCTPNAVI